MTGGGSRPRGSCNRGRGLQLGARAVSTDWPAGDTPDFLEDIGVVRRYRLQLRRDEMAA
jgi:hypothetical protein